jgi:hypothetical protein
MVNGGYGELQAREEKWIHNLSSYPECIGEGKSIGVWSILDGMQYFLGNQFEKVTIVM